MGVLAQEGQPQQQQPPPLGQQQQTGVMPAQPRRFSGPVQPQPQTPGQQIAGQVMQPQLGSVGWWTPGQNGVQVQPQQQQPTVVNPAAQQSTAWNPADGGTTNPTAPNPNATSGGTQQIQPGTGDVGGGPNNNSGSTPGSNTPGQQVGTLPRTDGGGFKGQGTGPVTYAGQAQPEGGGATSPTLDPNGTLAGGGAPSPGVGLARQIGGVARQTATGGANQPTDAAGTGDNKPIPQIDPTTGKYPTIGGVTPTGGTGTTSTTPDMSAYAPAYMGQLFPNGIPQSQVATSGAPPMVGAANLPGLVQQAAGAIPQVGTNGVTTRSTIDALGGLPQAQAGAVSSRDVLSQLGTPNASAAPVVSGTGSIYNDLGASSAGAGPVVSGTGSIYNDLGAAKAAASNVGTGSVLGAMNGSLDPGALTQAITAQMQPEFQRENRGLTESLANAGIVGGSTAGAVGDLAQQQETQLASTLAPFEQTANAQRLAGATTDAGNTLSASGQNASNTLAGTEFNASTDRSTLAADQQRKLAAATTNADNTLAGTEFNASTDRSTLAADQQRKLAAATTNQGADLNAQEFNQNLGYGTATSDAARALTAGTTNQGTQADLSKYNAGSILGTTQADLGRQLSADTTTAGNNLTASGANAGNAIGVGTSYSNQILSALQGDQQLQNQNSQFNASSLNSGNQFNISNDLNAAQYDTGSYNTMTADVLGLQNQDWLAQLGLNGQMAAGAAGGQTGAYQPVFQQPAPVSFAGLASSFAPRGTTAAPAAPSPYYPGPNGYQVA